MKSLLLAIILAAPVFGDIAWTHKNVEGQDGGLAADYVFYKTSMDKAADHIMSVHKVRAVYAYTNPQKEIIIAEYEYKSGLHVTISKTKSENLEQLSQGRDVRTEVVRQYVLELDGEKGTMAKLKIKKPLNIDQQNDLLNLSVLMTLERWPIKNP
jgi:hypothetical protein